MSSATQTSRTPWIIILLAMFIPTVSAYLYFDLLANSAPIAQKGAYGIGKIAQFGIFIVALYLWRQIAKWNTLYEKPAIEGRFLIREARGY
jgi:hypothetical protein